ncbi:MAG: virulence protein RhuM/Fic/DOC family protein [Desulfosalsimonadaceae bacterium]
MTDHVVEQKIGERGEIVIYQSAEGLPALDVRMEQETVWLTQKQMAVLFNTERSVITKHLRNVFKEGELASESVCAKFAHTAEDGKVYQTAFYNLDAIISVGYRVNSKRGTQFRIWATNVLREHLVRGVTVNRQRIETNAREMEAALELARRAVASPQLTADMGRGLVEVIAQYTQTFLLLQRYDEGLLTEPKGEAGGELPSVAEARGAILRLKETLMERKEAGEIFGNERSDGLAAILGNLNQSVFGAPAYPSIESTAAHLLYFIIKNHPFSDGNKRIGAMLFVDFLNRNRRLFLPSGEVVINDIGLAALALLIAESNPKDKEVLIRLIMNMLAKKQ